MSEWGIVIATGPSLRRDDADMLRGIGYTMAINCGVFFVPWADEVYAGDAVWWRYYGWRISWFRGKLVSRTYRSPDVIQWRGVGWSDNGGNSGCQGIQRMAELGKKKIALLGFDQQLTGGRAHNHADHPKFTKEGTRTNMANSGGVAAWPRKMNRVSHDLKMRGVEVVNLSRETALKCFPRMSVEQFVEDRRAECKRTSLESAA